MAQEPPRWRVNERPRFTALTLGAYMAADDGPRETLRRDMRYERIVRTTRYGHVRRAIARFLASPTRNLAILAECEDLLRLEISSASSRERRDNLSHELRALRDFQAGLNAIGIFGLQIWRHGHVFRPLSLAGVTVSVQPDALLRQMRPRGKPQIGAIIVDVAKGASCKTEDGLRRAEKAMAHSAVLIHMLVAGAVATEDDLASPEHCLVFHAHRSHRVGAPVNHKTMLKNLLAVCRDIKRAWPHIEPPLAFDPKSAEIRR